MTSLPCHRRHAARGRDAEETWIVEHGTDIRVDRDCSARDETRPGGVKLRALLDREIFGCTGPRDGASRRRRKIATSQCLDLTSVTTQKLAGPSGCSEAYHIVD